MPNEITFDTAAVKVMRSHDYCHFEVVLSSSAANTPAAVDELRKAAARLADKAVAQYRVAKRNAQRLLEEAGQREYVTSRIEEIRKKVEGDRTVREQAELKAYDDERWAASRAYDYEDDWDDDREY